jgi:hypothetical protein
MCYLLVVVVVISFLFFFFLFSFVGCVYPHPFTINSNFSFPIFRPGSPQSCKEM